MLAGTPLLASSHQDPLRASGNTVRWGVVSTGRIASIVASDLALLPDADLHAVSSRSRAGAEEFAVLHGFRRAYGDDGGLPGYLRLIQDPDVDIVYVATPHASHFTVARAALEAGKHVLCEKPMTLNARDAAILAGLAQSNGLFLMEAVWSRFLPSVQRAAEIIASGELGEIRMIQADLGFPAPRHPGARLWQRAAGGGALLDLGVYPLTWALLALGAPQSLAAAAHLTGDGVDAETAVTLTYASGAVSQFVVSLTTVSTQTATVSGTKGMLRCNAPLFNPTELVLTFDSGETRRETFVPAGHGYTYQLREVLRCLQLGHR
ncbi:Gfo/Idh/MocA family oxidoreductase [Pseudarthrobacter psychrotolerans]|uniref:Gfo/Idh/MocA family oxidoreductase n=1 Tax=Pseudarthrobacter psychrotolerans TaxID=2697569 RepID=A0A6P1NRD2_9MICC|nr:Gfo/Idh/MocA family oxidoreductase [Pseudarthrobacter psychrotolerans]